MQKNIKYMDIYVSEIIKKYGLTQQKVADMMGVSLQNIKYISSKKSPKPTIKTLERLAEIIGCDPREFFFDPRVSPFSNVFKIDKPEKVISTFVSNETGKKYKIVEIEE